MILHQKRQNESIFGGNRAALTCNFDRIVFWLWMEARGPFVDLFSPCSWFWIYNIHFTIQSLLLQHFPISWELTNCGFAGLVRSSGLNSIKQDKYVFLQHVFLICKRSS
jgi:hypothetical protein